MHIFYQLGFPFRRRTANTHSHRNADASGPPGKGSKHQFTVNQAVKAGPIAVRQEFAQQSRGIGHIGYCISLTGGHSLHGFKQGGVDIGLAGPRSGCEIVHALGL